MNRTFLNPSSLAHQALSSHAMMTVVREIPSARAASLTDSKTRHSPVLPTSRQRTFFPRFAALEA
jgi:hypothetical protein